MNSSNYRFILDMHSTQSQISIPVMHRDTNRKLYISLSNGKDPYVIEDGCLAAFVANKPDGTSIYSHCTIENNNTIVYEFTENTSSAEGIVKCEVRLYGADNKLITSPRFILIVDARVLNDDDIDISESENTIIDSIILSEANRVENEALRVTAEEKRANQETARETEESLRANAEINRNGAETSRQSAENQRAAAESARATEEIARKNAEDARAEADAERGARMDQFDEAVATLNRKLDDIIDDGKLEEVLTVAYPVGAIYMSVSEEAPASLFGGTWEKLESRFLLGSGNGWGAGTRGGSASVTLTEMHLPSNTIVELHNNTSSNLSYTADAVKDETITTDRLVRYDLYMPVSEREDIGLGAYEQEAIDTMPPFYTVHMWKRIA